MSISATARGRRPAWPPSLFYGWYIVGATFLAGFIAGGFFSYGIGAFFLSFEQQFSQNSRGLISLALGLAPLQGAILGPLQGYLVDRVGPRPVMLFGVTLFGLGWVLLSTADSLGMFVAFFLLIAIGNGMGFVAPPLATVGNWFVRHRGLAFGIAGGGFSLGSVLVPLVNFFIDSFEWEGAALAVGIIGWVVGYPIAFIMRRRPEQYGLYPDGADTPPSSVDESGAQVEEINFTAREAIITKAFWLMYASFSIRSLVISAVAVHAIAAMVEKDIGPSAGAAIVATIGFASIPGRLLAGVIVDKMDKRHFSMGVSALMGISLLIFVWASGVWLLVLFAIVYALGIGGTGTVQFAIRGEYFGRKAFATISGFGSILMGAGAMIGAWTAGFVFDRAGTYDPAFYLYAGLSLLAMAAIFLARRPPPRSAPLGGP